MNTIRIYIITDDIIFNDIQNKKRKCFFLSEENINRLRHYYLENDILLSLY